VLFRSWKITLPGGLVPGVSRPGGEIREGWLEGPGGRAATRPVADGEQVAKAATGVTP